MTGSAGGSRSGFDWRSALLMAVLGVAFLAGRISVSQEVQRLRDEIETVSKALHAAQEQYAAAAGIGDMEMPDPLAHGAGHSQTVARSRAPQEVVE
jgi:hypothetical protein